MSKQTIFKALPVIILSSLLTVAIIYAWREPTQAPPHGNVPAPINVGGTTQFKSGALGIGGVLRGYSTAIFDGHVGIGTTTPGARLTIDGGTLEYSAIFARGGGAERFALNVNVGQGWSLFDFENNVWNRGITQRAGNVGIGTMRPNSRLEVAGTIHSTIGGFRFPDGTTQTTAPGKQLFTSSGTFHVPPGVTRVWVSMAGGGGGGGGGGAGSRAGTYGETIITGGSGGGGGGGHAVIASLQTVSPGAAITVTIGAGGAGGRTIFGVGDGSVGGGGGTTSFGALISAPGGAGGTGGFGAFGGNVGGGGGAGSPGFVLVEW